MLGVNKVARFELKKLRLGTRIRVVGAHKNMASFEKLIFAVSLCGLKR